MNDDELSRAREARKKWQQRVNQEQTAAGWKDHAIMPDKVINPLPILENACIALEHAPQFQNLFGWDEMLAAPMIFNSDPRQLTDEDVTEVQRVLQREGLRRIGHVTVHQAIRYHCLKHKYHPIRDYLEGLQWDGTPRIGRWLTIYLGAEDTTYSQAIGKMFLIAMVARIFRPGCKADYMPVLEGPQGILKSSACKVLATEKYFTDALKDIESKDASIHLRGKWVVEHSEMHAIGRAEATSLKAFMSRTHEKFRPPYLREDVIEPRQCVFVGTSNKDQYLRDETGGRRFWPVKCGAIDLTGLEHDRDQILAEAVVRFEGGEPWWPDHAFEAEHITPQQEARYEADEWSSLIQDWLDHHLIAERFTMAQVAKEALGLEAARLDMLAQKRIAASLRQLNCEVRIGHRDRFWRRKT